MKSLSKLPNHITHLEDFYRRFVTPEERSNFFFEMENAFGNVTALNFSDELWEHVMLEPITTNRCPRWTEMVRLKETFWGKNEVVIQVHPAQKDYINIQPYTLHLWKHKKTSYDLSVVTEVMSMLVKDKHETFYSFTSSYRGTKFIAIYGGSRWPTWEEVCREKRHFFGPDCPAVQYHISREIDLNNQFLLTLWDATNIQLPPKRLV